MNERRLFEIGVSQIRHVADFLEITLSFANSIRHVADRVPLCAQKQPLKFDEL
jgi:hypothetical protein